MFQHSLMNLGVETLCELAYTWFTSQVSAFSDESWGGDPIAHHNRRVLRHVSAFSDESWGGDQRVALHALQEIAVSAFSDESWGGDPLNMTPNIRIKWGFSIL